MCIGIGSNNLNVSTPHSTPEQLQEIRNRLRNSGSSQSTQIGMVLNEFADLMEEVVPRMRQVADNLREENQSSEQEVAFAVECRKFLGQFIKHNLFF